MNTPEKLVTNFKRPLSNLQFTKPPGRRNNDRRMKNEDESKETVGIGKIKKEFQCLKLEMSKANEENHNLRSELKKITENNETLKIELEKFDKMKEEFQVENHKLRTELKKITEDKETLKIELEAVKKEKVILSLENEPQSDIIDIKSLPLQRKENYLKNETLLLNKDNVEILVNHWILICQNDINEFIQLMVLQSVSKHLLDLFSFQKRKGKIYIKGSNLLDCWAEAVSKKFPKESENKDAFQKKIQKQITTIKNTMGNNN